MRGKLLAPPLIVALGVHVLPNHKIPEIEQMLAVGAAAMNMLNAAYALGFGGMWVNPAVAASIGTASAGSSGGVPVSGHASRPAAAGTTPGSGEHVREWSPAEG